MKTTRARSVEQLVEEQVQRWRLQHEQKKEAPQAVTMITVSRECGSGGTRLAEQLAESLDYAFFDRQVMHEIAQSAQISDRLLNSLDEKGLNMVEEWIAALIQDRHLWPDQFMRHLMKVIGTIGKNGRAVVVGRGAHFVLPPDQTLRLRVIASLEKRVASIAERYNLSNEDARTRVFKTDADRRAFSRKYFYSDLSDPLRYDLILNMDQMGVNSAAQAVKGALEQNKA